MRCGMVRTPFHFPAQKWSFLTPFFCSPARDVVVAGTADGSLHLINPNAWRRRIRQIQAHKLCAAISTIYALSLTLLI
jgi:hypothetical protein